MKYLLFYIPNKNKLDSSFMEQTRTLLMTAPYSLTQLPIFTETPFIIPRFKIGIQKVQPLNYTLSDPHEAFVNVDELVIQIENTVEQLKIVLNQKNNNADYNYSSIIPLESNNYLLLSHKQQLDLLNQLLLLKQEIQLKTGLNQSTQSNNNLLTKQNSIKITQKLAVSPEQKQQHEQLKEYENFDPNKKENVYSLKQEAEKNGNTTSKARHHHKEHHHHNSNKKHHSNKQIKQLENQVYQLQQNQIDTLLRFNNKQASPIQHIIQQSQHNQVDKKCISKNILQQIDQKLCAIEEFDDNINLNEQQMEYKKEAQQVINAYEDYKQLNNEQFKNSITNKINQLNVFNQDINKKQIQYATYLPKFSKEQAFNVKQIYKQQQKENENYQTRGQLSVAYFRSKLDKRQIHQIVSDEILIQLVDQVAVEFGQFVKEVVIDQ